MRKYLFFITTALAVSSPAFAQDNQAVPAADAVRDDLITVVATGGATRVDWAGQAISVIGDAEVRSVQGTDLTRVLERLPGVTLARNGGLGATTSLFVRGANSQQLLVMVDGIRVADVAAPGGGYDFGGLSSGGIGKIELLRGSNSVIWGSEAIGGVLALTSRDIDGVQAGIEYGSRDSVDAQVDGGVVGDRYAINLNGGYSRTDGISQFGGGSERDGYRQWRVGGRAHVDLTPELTARVVGRYSDGRTDIDGYPAPAYVFADDPEYQKSREIGALAGLRYSGEALTLDASYQLSDTRRRYYDPTFSPEPNYETQGQTRRAQLAGSYNILPALRLDFGADHEWSRFDVSFEERRRANLSSGHAMLGWYSDAVTVAAGLRYDDHSRFGDAWTFGANGSVALVGALRARASYGEGFKVPTLYQLFSDYGNEDLRPERSRSYDAGLEWGDRNGALFAAVTGFRRDSRNLIDYVSCFSTSNPLCDDGRYGFYDNVGKARATGVEVELAAQVSPALRARASYTYVKTTNRTAGDPNEGNDLARRPRNAITVSLDWTSPWGLVLGGDIRMVSDAYDNATNTKQIDGWATGTIRASLPLGEHFELFGRVENVTDSHYEVVSGYGTVGRSAFAGVRVKM
ncbi:TonB-dependent receptor plug domain-containing protein [Novosphingobium colocasiae]|uniref:TonB-dependent receptor plug domain-containing protein n=1 Tax=Novosphingobium colocasiae TaxID=1256513 RepID=UPI0035ADF814